VVFAHAVERNSKFGEPRIAFAQELGELSLGVLFILSGFFITLILRKDQIKNGRINFKQFYFRRLTRILPPVFAYIFVLAILKSTAIVTRLDTGELLTSLFFVRNLYPGSFFTGHFWTLAIDEQFYLFWPLLLTILPLNSKVLRACFVGLFAGAPFVFAYGGILPVVSSQIVASMIISMGCVLGLHECSSNMLLKRLLSLRIFVPMVIGLLGCSFLVEIEFVQSFYLRSFAAAFIVYFLAVNDLQRTLYNKFLNMRVFVFLGKISYSLYVWQQLLFGINPPSFRSIPLRILVCIVMAIASYYIIERPVLRWRDRRQGKMPLKPEGSVFFPFNPSKIASMTQATSKEV